MFRGFKRILLPPPPPWKNFCNFLPGFAFPNYNCEHCLICDFFYFLHFAPPKIILRKKNSFLHYYTYHTFFFWYKSVLQLSRRFIFNLIKKKKNHFSTKLLSNFYLATRQLRACNLFLCIHSILNLFFIFLFFNSRIRYQEINFM